MNAVQCSTMRVVMNGVHAHHGEKSSDISISNVWHIAQEYDISARNLAYSCISVVWHISQDFDISVRILYRLPLQYKPFCTVFHCSTKPGVFASGTWESHSVPSFTPPPTKLLPFSQTTTRAVTPVAVGRRPLYARQD